MFNLIDEIFEYKIIIIIIFTRWYILLIYKLMASWIFANIFFLSLVLTSIIYFFNIFQQFYSIHFQYYYNWNCHYQFLLFLNIISSIHPIITYIFWWNNKNIKIWVIFVEIKILFIWALAIRPFIMNIFIYTTWNFFAFPFNLSPLNIFL